MDVSEILVCLLNGRLVELPLANRVFVAFHVHLMHLFDELYLVL